MTSPKGELKRDRWLGTPTRLASLQNADNMGAVLRLEEPWESHKQQLRLDAPRSMKSEDRCQQDGGTEDRCQQDGGTEMCCWSQLVPLPPLTDVQAECQGQGGSCPGSHTEDGLSWLQNGAVLTPVQHSIPEFSLAGFTESEW